MGYTLNEFFQMPDMVGAPRVLVYPNRTTAAHLVKHLKNKGATVIKLSDCLPQEFMYLPMPYRVMSMIDENIRTSNSRVLMLGLDAYLALLDEDGINSFMTGLQKRLDSGLMNVDYLLYSYNKPSLPARYEESLKIICLNDDVEYQEAFTVTAYSDQWAKEGDCVGYRQLLAQVGSFAPSGKYTLFLSNMSDRQSGIGTAVTFVSDIYEIASQKFGIDITLDCTVLEELLLTSVKSGTAPEHFLSKQFGETNCNVRFALKRLLELPHNDMWQAYVWYVKKRIPTDSYMARVLSDGVTFDNLLWKYAVGTAVSVLTEDRASQFALERGEALTTLSGIEPLIVEFITHTKDYSSALPFLNCGTSSERQEILRRASEEDLRTGLPYQYAKLYPLLADYLSPYEYPSHDITDYFKEYRRLRIRNTVTEDFVQLAFQANAPASYPSRDTVLNSLRNQPDTALLVVDGMGAEFIPLLLELSKRQGMNIESCVVATANIPTETKFNPISWSKERTLPSVKGPDNIVHDGAEKHEESSPERSFVKTLQMFEMDVMTRIANGLSCFSRVAVTADHGSSRLALIAWQENKGITLPWDKEKNGEPLNWRYTLAPKDGKRPAGLKSQYFPSAGNTYWVVRGYNRLPKQGGKFYGMHGGAALEETLVPILIFTRNMVTVAPPKVQKARADDLGDNLEGLI